jgi:hypothetical protein
MGYTHIDSCGQSVEQKVVQLSESYRYDQSFTNRAIEFGHTLSHCRFKFVPTISVYLVTQIYTYEFGHSLSHCCLKYVPIIAMNLVTSCHTAA